MIQLDKDIIEKLISSSTSHKLSNDELVIRCPYCGDSTDTKKHHLYIKLSTDEISFPFHCFKCDTSGTIIKLMSDMKLLSSDIIPKLYNSHKENGYKFIENHNNIEFKISNHKPDNIKLDYVLHRLNNNSDMLDKIKNSIITDFNSVKNLNVSPGMMNLLNGNYVGFLTLNKKKIISRRINDSDLTKYITLKISNDSIDYFTYFENLRLLDKGIIVLAEGIFTLLNGYTKLKDKIDLNNSILVAGAGKSFIKSLKFIQYTFGVPDFDIYILADSDVDKSFFKKQFYNYKSKFIKILYCDKNDFADDWTKYSITNLY